MVVVKSFITAKSERWARWLFPLCLFFIPLGPSLNALIWFLSAAAALCLLPHYQEEIKLICRSSWGLGSIALLVFIFIACFWSPASYLMQWSVFKKYIKLLVFPLLVLGFIHPQRRLLGLNAYLAAMSLTSLLSLLKAMGIMHWGDPDPGAVFYNHIITGFMVALAAYIAALLGLSLKKESSARIFYVFVFILTSYQVLFVNTGKTGYVVYMVLMILLLLQTLSLKKALVGFVFFSASMMSVYYASPMMQAKVHDLVYEMKSIQAQKRDNSLGFRLQFHQYAQSLFLEHPLLGVGTGGFKYRFSQDNPIPAWGKELTEPHSQYWFILAEQGVIGFTLFLVFLGSLWRTSFQLLETRAILCGLLSVFCLACTSDTLFSYSALGHLLLAFTALCFGELLELSMSKAN